MIEDAVPNNWKVVEWADVVTIISGKNQKDVIDENGNFPIYGSGGVMGYSNKYLCNANCTIVGRKGTINNPIYVTRPFWNVDTAFGIEPHREVNPKYLYYFCKSFNFKKLDNSTTIPSLAKTVLLSIKMPLAPKPEQDRIVAKLDELFSEIDKGVEALQKTKEQLRVYRYAVLEDCVICENVIAIRDCISEIGQGWSPKCINESTSDPGVWAVIKTSAIQNCRFDETENKILPATLAPREKHQIQVDDILITRAGPRTRCGICCLVKRTKTKLINCDKVYRLRVDKSKALPQFIEYVLNTPSLVKKIEFCKTGGNDSGLNLTQNRFLDLTIPLPSIEEQSIIVSEIESRLSVCDKIEQTVDGALMQADNLRQSILKKVFEGKLIY